MIIWFFRICIRENKNKWNKQDKGKACRDFLQSAGKSHKENKKLLQEYHTQADENKAVETAILIMHFADCAPILWFWKWIHCICSTREFSVGEYIKLKCFQKYLEIFFSHTCWRYFEQLCFISEPIFTFCCQLLLLLSPLVLLNSRLPPNLSFMAYISSTACHWFFCFIFTISNFFQLSTHFAFFFAFFFNQEGKKLACGFLSN